ncbi:MAG TPA: amidohydrolase, partial [Parvularculaceae bacterium]|nr:amidohydrolase [Parvularculaceae bacterium]
MRLMFLAAAAFLPLSPALAAEAPTLSPEAKKVIAGIDARHGDIADLASKIWGYAEVGYKE